jgi:hypothetical protein
VRTLLASSLVLLILGVTSCSIGASAPRSGGAQLTVTRDFGGRVVLRAREDPLPGGETVMRLLLRNARVGTRYGGRFVQSVNGTSSRAAGGRRSDWFYYVNGIEAEVGAAERDVKPGDRIWWDYHDWTAAMRVPAVVGSFPEPFLRGSEGKLFPVRIDCAQHAEQACREVAKRLERVGVGASTTAIGAATGKEVLRLVVGEWKDVRRDAAARQLEQGPAKSGVFARLSESGAAGSSELDLLDEQDRVVRSLGRSAAIVAATRFEEQQPTWVIAGTDGAGLGQAVRLVDPRILRDRFAVASDGRTAISLPVLGGAS